VGASCCSSGPWGARGSGEFSSKQALSSEGSSCSLSELVRVLVCAVSSDPSLEFRVPHLDVPQLPDQRAQGSTTSPHPEGAALPSTGVCCIWSLRVLEAKVFLRFLSLRTPTCTVWALHLWLVGPAPLETPGTFVPNIRCAAANRWWLNRGGGILSSLANSLQWHRCALKPPSRVALYPFAVGLAQSFPQRKWETLCLWVLLSGSSCLLPAIAMHFGPSRSTTPRLA